MKVFCILFSIFSYSNLQSYKVQNTYKIINTKTIKDRAQQQCITELIQLASLLVTNPSFSKCLESLSGSVSVGKYSKS